MLEIPESTHLANQMTALLCGRTICRAEANHSPHGFAWYWGEPKHYGSLLEGETVSGCRSYGGFIEIAAGNKRIVLWDGVSVHYLAPGEKRPVKHQLLLDFDDGSALYCTIQMYGGIWASVAGEFDNNYTLAAQQKPSPLSDDFTYPYFLSLLGPKERPLSAKGFLATQQRIPGLGNGVLQDILFQARIHPKRRMDSLGEAELQMLYHAVRSVLQQMTEAGGRDTEKDLFGVPGGYRTILSKKTVGSPCPVCGTVIQKAAYLGGSIYFCTHCQPLIYTREDGGTAVRAETAKKRSAGPSKLDRVLSEMQSVCSAEEYRSLLENYPLPAASDEKKPSPAVQGRAIRAYLKEFTQLYGPDTARQVMRPCGHHCISAATIRTAKKLYRQSEGNWEVFLRLLNESHIGGGELHMEDGKLIAIYHRCCCGLAKNTKNMPESYCACSAGWFEKLFSSVLERPVTVCSQETILSGGERCLFSILLDSADAGQPVQADCGVLK